MKILSKIDHSEAQNATAQMPIRVCMHDLESARTDPRVMREATALVEAGFDVTIVDAESDPTRPSEEDLREVHLKHIKDPNWFLSTRFKPWFLVKAARMLFRGVFRLIQVPADIYHAHDERALPACYIVARLRRKPLVFDSHEMPLTEPSVTRWRRLHAIARWLLARMVPYCTSVIAVSPPIAKELHNLYHGPEVTLIRNVPVYRSVEKSDRLQQHLGLSLETRIALYQGLLLPDRGLDRLIRAARFLEQNIMIVMLGDGPEEVLSSLKSLIASEGVADRVKMVPGVPYEELLDWTTSADVGLILFAPDYSLNVKMCLPNKFFEYLMAGLPILCSQLDVVADIVRSYKVGQIVALLEPANIGRAINEILADPVACARMGRNGVQAVQHDFCWEKERGKLTLLYQGILTGENYG